MLSSGNPVSVRPPRLHLGNIEKSYKWQSHTFSPIPSFLKREVNRKSCGVCFKYWTFTTDNFSQASRRTVVFFFCYTTSPASTWTFCWKSCSLKTLNNQVPLCTRSVQFYLCQSVCRCVCMGLFLLNGAPQITSVKRDFPLPVAARTVDDALRASESEHTHIHTPWTKYIQYVQTEANS